MYIFRGWLNLHYFRRLNAARFALYLVWISNICLAFYKENFLNSMNDDFELRIFKTWQNCLLIHTTVFERLNWAIFAPHLLQNVGLYLSGVFISDFLKSIFLESEVLTNGTYSIEPWPLYRQPKSQGSICLVFCRAIF